MMKLSSIFEYGGRTAATVQLELRKKTTNITRRTLETESQVFHFPVRNIPDSIKPLMNRYVDEIERKGDTLFLTIEDLNFQE